MKINGRFGDVSFCNAGACDLYFYIFYKNGGDFYRGQVVWSCAAVHNNTRTRSERMFKLYATRAQNTFVANKSQKRPRPDSFVTEKLLLEHAAEYGPSRFSDFILPVYSSPLKYTIGNRGEIMLETVPAKK